MNPLKLNLGGRNTTIPGFKVVDIYNGENVDIKADISNLNMIEAASVDEIYASHCLEHFGHFDTLRVLKEWRRIMRPGGKCYIGVPDFRALVRLYEKVGLTQFIIDLGWGGQEYKEAFHYTPFDFPRLSRLVIDAGFSDVKQLAELPYGLKDCSSLRDTVTGQLISLNIEAVA